MNPSLSYIHPQQGLLATAESLPELTEQLARLAPRQHIRFVAQPFSLDPEFLQQLRTQFSYEKLQEKLSFSAEVQLQELSEDNLERLQKLHFTQLLVPLLPEESLDLNQLENLLKQSQNLKIQLQFKLNRPNTPIPQKKLVELYFFLHNWCGWYTLEIAPGLFSDPHTARRFDRLSRLSGNVFTGLYLQKRFTEQIYRYYYEFLRIRLSHHVKSILEINPYAEESYFRDFPRQLYPWKVTLLSLAQHKIDQDYLKSLGKTFDAIVFFQGLETLRDPQKELLLLQKYTRLTTEWLFFSYNLASMPPLLKLLQNNFENVSTFSPDYSILKLLSRKSLEKLFEFLGIRFQFVPTRLPLGDFQARFDQIRPLFENHLPESWKTQAEELDIMAYSAYGTLEMEEELQESDGFISGGFLS